ncbi:hypothetical protein M0811_10155 [Anaeramoeba ignava]|uniref:non-specific serine/threonine protein kinase n=1 Tax=Anaeramoeba ignava TaxID=1746090 RepID=A0A9Q0LF04_ANAIG|nr:hypothetical protein M0811_10155 [Anaeramoeba ignava]
MTSPTVTTNPKRMSRGYSQPLIFLNENEKLMLEESEPNSPKQEDSKTSIFSDDTMLKSFSTGNFQSKQIFQAQKDLLNQYQYQYQNQNENENENENETETETDTKTDTKTETLTENGNESENESESSFTQNQLTLSQNEPIFPIEEQLNENKRLNSDAHYPKAYPKAKTLSKSLKLKSTKTSKRTTSKNLNLHAYMIFKDYQKVDYKLKEARESCTKNLTRMIKQIEQEMKKKQENQDIFQKFVELKKIIGEILNLNEKSLSKQSWDRLVKKLDMIFKKSKREISYFVSSILFNTSKILRLISLSESFPPEFREIMKYSTKHVAIIRNGKPISPEKPIHRKKQTFSIEMSCPVAINNTLQGNTLNQEDGQSKQNKTSLSPTMDKDFKQFLIMKKALLNNQEAQSRIEEKQEKIKPKKPEKKDKKIVHLNSQEEIINDKLIESKKTDLEIPYLDPNIQQKDGQIIVCRICGRLVLSDMIEKHSGYCVIEQQSRSKIRYCDDTLQKFLVVPFSQSVYGKIDLENLIQNNLKIIVNCCLKINLNSESAVIKLKKLLEQIQVHIGYGKKKKCHLPRDINEIQKIFLQKIESFEKVFQTSPNANLTAVYGSETNANLYNIHSLQSFEFIKLISRGAYGKVFLAQSKTTRDIFAIKVLRKNDMIQKNQTEHIKTEKNILTRTVNDFVVKLFYSFQTKKYLYLVMEYMNGGDLYSLLKNVGYLSEKMAKFYLSEIILAIEYIHSKNIVHRDLKPDNVLIGNDGHLKLTDFGLSRIGIYERQEFDELDRVNEGRYEQYKNENEIENENQNQNENENQNENQNRKSN